MSKEPSVRPKKGTKKPKSQTPKSDLSKARSMAQTAPTRALRQQASALLSPLTRQEAATLEYAHTITNPWVEEPSGVPLVLGSGTVRTNKAQVLFEGQATANSSGFAFVAVALDGWVPTGADDTAALPYQYASYSGGTQGTPIWYSGATYTGFGAANPTKLPSSADTTGSVAGLTSIAMRLLDGSVTSKTKIRLVAAGLRVFSDAAVNTAQGKLCVVATSMPVATPANGGLAGAAAAAGTDYATASGMPQDLVSFETLPCAGWKSGTALHVVGIPTDPVAFQMLLPPAAGATVFDYPQLCAILSGGASGQTFTFQVVFDYEFQFSMTNVTGVSDDPIYNVGPGAVSNIHASISQQGMASKGPLLLTNGNSTKGVTSFLSNVHATTPGRAPQILQLATKKPSGGTFTNNVGNVLSKVAHGALGLIGKYAPGWMGNVAEGAKGVLNFLGF